MRIRSSTFFALLLAAALLPTTGCSKETAATTATVIPLKSTPVPATPVVAAAPAATPAEPNVVPSPPVPPNVFTEMNEALDKATRDEHAGLSLVEQRMAKEIDVQVAALKATANVSLPAGEKLDTAKEDFAEKLRMLTLASAETWTSSKHDTELSLQTLRSAFAEIMSSPPKK